MAKNTRRVDDALTAFLWEDSSRQFAYGSWDCLLRLAGWAERQTGLGVAGHWFGLCTSKFGATRILLAEGGMVALVDKAFSPLGYFRTDCPKRGDIAIVDGQEGLTGGIVLDEAEGGMVLVSLAQDRAIRISRAPLVAAWTL